MKLLKRFLKSPAAQEMAAFLAALYIYVVHYTNRWKILGQEHVEAYLTQTSPVIVAFWHGRLMMMANYPSRGKKICVVISRHRDGALIAKAMRYFGLSAVRGSSSKGGPAAVKKLLEQMEMGRYAAFTPDGPRGPRMHADMGVIRMAQKTGAPVIPLSASTTRRKVIKSWDRFLLALPFGRGVYIIGIPVIVPADADEQALEACRLRLEQELNRLSAEADRLTGHAPIEPA